MFRPLRFRLFAGGDRESAQDERRDRKAIDKRRLDASERFVKVQAARITKALPHADLKLERGDIRAFEPYMKLVAALDRYHGLGQRGTPLLPPATEGPFALAARRKSG